MKEMERPHTLIEEDQQAAHASPAARVEAMFEQIMAKLPGPPDFILCVLPVRKNSDIYGKAVPVVEIYFLKFIILLIFSMHFQGPWKKKCLSDMGIVTQCICPVKINDQYLTNVLLKINTKVNLVSMRSKNCFNFYVNLCLPCTMIFLMSLLFIAWRNQFFVGNRATFQSPIYKRYSDIDFRNGCLSWLSWSI